MANETVWHQGRRQGRADRITILEAMEGGETAAGMAYLTKLPSSRVSQLLSSMYWYDALTRSEDNPRRYWPGRSFTSYLEKLRRETHAAC